MHFICRSFIGKHNANNWAQFWENESDDFSVASKRGHLFGLLNISTPEIDPEIIKTGKSIISEINQFYYSSPHDQVDASLQYCLESVAKSSLSDIITDLVLVIVHQDTLHTGVCKSGVCTLSRGQQISRLLDINDFNTKIISGKITSGDKVLLSTKIFQQKITWEKIKNIISDTKIQNIEENFLSELYSLDDQSGASAVIVQIISDDENTIPSLPEVTAKPPVDNPPPSPKVFPQVKSGFTPKRINPGFFKKFFSPKPIFVSSQESSVKKHRTKINNIVAVFILIALGAGSYYGFVQNRQKSQEAQYQQLKTEIESRIANSLAVKNMNLEDAIKEARNAQSILDKISALKIHPQEVEKYKQDITQILSQSGSASEYKPEFYADNGVIVDSPQYSRMLLSRDSLLIIDSAASRVDSVEIPDRNNSVFSQDKDINKGLAFAVSEGKLFSLTETGVFQITKTGSPEVLAFSKITTSPKPTKPVSLYFWTNALYLLDPANSSIWKSTPADSVFGPPQSWLKAGESLDSDSTNLAINGKVWVLSASGRLTAYTRGVKENFALQSVSALTKTAHLNIGTDSETIVFSDNDNIVYVYDKTGKYKSSYNYGDLKILDLVFYEKTNQIFVLCSDQKIYKISL
ncbi:MAG: hypothetical protein WC841_05600 [Candidatus Shapirobacteria bacterium]|jgi:hypothetical protein